MRGTIYRSAVAEQEDSEEGVRLAYAIINSQAWDTSTQTVQRIWNWFTDNRDELVNG
jgi:hypothetical protein